MEIGVERDYTKVRTCAFVMGVWAGCCAVVAGQGGEAVWEHFCTWIATMRASLGSSGLYEGRIHTWPQAISLPNSFLKPTQAWGCGREALLRWMGNPVLVVVSPNLAAAS